MQEGFERVELVVGEYRYGSSRTIAFQGRLAAERGDVSAYITPKRNILVHFDYPTEGTAYHKIYGTIEEARKEENNDGEQLYSSEFLQEIAEELGEEYIEELDI